MDPRFQAGCAFVDGQYVPIDEARVPLTDMGFTRSDCTYDVVAVWQGAFFRLDDHLARFERGCLCLQLQPPLPFDALPAVLAGCVQRAGLSDAYVEMICTRGVPPPGERDPRRVANRFYAFAVPYVWIATPAQQQTGISLVIATRTERIAARAVDPTVKNFQWGDFVRAQFEAGEREHHTAVLLDRDGHVTEGPGFNLFAYVRGTLLTPAEGVLHGITRQTVMELAARHGIAVRTTRFDADALGSADEIFLSSTAGGLLPVTQLDGRPVGDGRPGPLWAHLHEAYWAAHASGPWVTPVAGLVSRLRG